MAEQEHVTTETLNVNGRNYEYYSLESVEGARKLPYSLTVLLENVVRCARNAEEAQAQYEGHLRIVEALENGDVEAGMEAITHPSLDFYRVEGIPAALYMG